jgi:hypothetical protein
MTPCKPALPTLTAWLTYHSRMFGQANNNYNALNLAHNLSEAQVRQAHSFYAQAATKLDGISRLVQMHEAALGIEARWSSESPEYKATLVEIHLRDYRHALDRLEHLIVQRMFELSKLGMSGVGEFCRF